jgi:hypothetical protein
MASLQGTLRLFVIFRFAANRVWSGDALELMSSCRLGLCVDHYLKGGLAA